MDLCAECDSNSETPRTRIHHHPRRWRRVNAVSRRVYYFISDFVATRVAPVGLVAAAQRASIIALGLIRQMRDGKLHSNAIYLEHRIHAGQRTKEPRHEHRNGVRLDYRFGIRLRCGFLISRNVNEIAQVQ